MEAKYTDRGFKYFEAKDSYDGTFKLQQSSSGIPHIWFGKSAEILVMAKDAHRVGLDGGDGRGWVKYPLPDCVYVLDRMHLSQKQVKELLPILQKFADTGEI